MIDPSNKDNIDMVSSTSEILNLVGRAVTCMHAKDYRGAFSPLTQALRLNKALIMITSRPDVSSEYEIATTTDEGAMCCQHDSSLLCCQLLNTCMAASNASQVDLDDASEEPFLEPCEQFSGTERGDYYYVHPVPVTVGAFFDPRLDVVLQRGIAPHDLQATLAVIIIYNLALAHHLNALESIRGIGPSYFESSSSSSVAKSLLSRAMSLYEHSKSLLYQLNVLDSTWLLNLFIANNQAQILVLLGEQAAADEIFKGILSRLCCFLSDRYYYHQAQQDPSSSSCCFFPPGSLLEGFIHNTSHLILKSRTAGAA